MKKILIITEKRDHHADAVIEELYKLECKVFRLNTEDFINKYKFKLEYGNESIFFGEVIDSLGRVVDLNKISSAYYRKPIKVLPHDGLVDPGAIEYSLIESEIALKLIYTYPNIKWVNSPFKNQISQLKFSQLYYANYLGLKIPKTLITNSIDEANNFFKVNKYNVICKSMQTNPVQLENIPYQPFTYKLNFEEINEKLNSIKFAPTFLQEYIEKKFELRINVIGSKVFATLIDSQLMDISKIDWRKTNPINIPHRPFKLPIDIKSKLVKFVKLYGLYFSAIDMIVSPDNEFIFLENNPNGQWYWIELLTKQKIAKSIASLLYKL